MLNRSHLVALVLIAACHVPDVNSPPRADGGTGVDGGTGTVRCARLGFPSVLSPTTGAGPQSVAVADVSGDGKPDLVVANNRASTVSMLVGTHMTATRFADFANFALQRPVVDD